MLIGYILSIYFYVVACVFEYVELLSRWAPGQSVASDCLRNWRWCDILFHESCKWNTFFPVLYILLTSRNIQRQLTRPLLGILAIQVPKGILEFY